MGENERDILELIYIRQRCHLLSSRCSYTTELNMRQKSPRAAYEFSIRSTNEEWKSNNTKKYMMAGRRENRKRETKSVVF